MPTHIEVSLFFKIYLYSNSVNFIRDILNKDGFSYSKSRIISLGELSFNFKVIYSVYLSKSRLELLIFLVSQIIFKYYQYL